MRYISLLSVVALSACSTLDPLTEWPFEDDTADTGSDDSSQDSNTNVDTGDSNVDSDTAADPCAFQVTVWDLDSTDGENYPESSEDEITMENELAATLAETSPEGLATPSSELTIAHVSFTVPNAECPVVTLTNFQFSVYGMDYNHVAWEDAIKSQGVTFRTLDDNQLIATTADGVFYGDGSEDPDWFTWYSNMPQSVQIDPGTTTTITVTIDASGAQAGDSVNFRLSPDSIWYTVAGNAQVAELRHSSVDGIGLTF